MRSRWIRATIRDDPSFVPGYAVLLDVDACPAQYLPFLAQFNGTALPVGVDPATARQMIRAESGQQRGTVAAIVNAAKRNLTGTQSCIVIERTAADGITPDAYHFLIILRPEELVSLAALQTAVNAVKPAGVFYTVIQTDGWTITQMEASQASLTALEAVFSTTTHLEQDVIG